jgi:hypothetical protein
VGVKAAAVRHRHRHRSAARKPKFPAATHKEDSDSRHGHAGAVACARAGVRARASHRTLTAARLTTHHAARMWTHTLCFRLRADFFLIFFARGLGEGVRNVDPDYKPGLPLFHGLRPVIHSPRVAIIVQPVLQTPDVL